MKSVHAGMYLRCSDHQFFKVWEVTDAHIGLKLLPQAAGISVVYSAETIDTLNDRGATICDRASLPIAVTRFLQ